MLKIFSTLPSKCALHRLVMSLAVLGSVMAKIAELCSSQRVMNLQYYLGISIKLSVCNLLMLACLVTKVKFKLV